MDDADGARTPALRRGRRPDDRPAHPAVVAALAAVVIALAALAATLASPPAGADDASGLSVVPAQAEPAGRATPDVEDSAEATPRGGDDGGALAWWMAGEVAVLVVGCTLWCRRANRRQSLRLDAASGARSGPGAVTLADRQAPAPRPSPRYRL